MEKNEEKFLRTCRDLKSKERAYKEMSKDTLVNLLMLKEMFDEAFEPEGRDMSLWCYVADKDGCKYITDEKPEVSYLLNSGAVTLSEGQVNIRVPKRMEAMFPDVKYGDEPVKVSLSVSF